MKTDQKGFTLIELLAVIVILGVLMIIAVPMVTQYITSAKRGAFLSTAKAYVSSARYSYMNGDYQCGDNVNIDTGSGGTVLIPFNQIQVDKANGKSSFSRNMVDKSYVIIHSLSSGQYIYYVRMIDDGSNGFLTPTDEDKLEKKDVKIKTSTYSSATVPAAGSSVPVSTATGKDAITSVKIDGVCTLDRG